MALSKNNQDYEKDRLKRTGSSYSNLKYKDVPSITSAAGKAVTFKDNEALAKA